MADKETAGQRSNRLSTETKRKKARMREAMRKHKACVPRRVCIHPETGEVKVVLGKDCPREYAEAYAETVPKKGIVFSYKDDGVATDE